MTAGASPTDHAFATKLAEIVQQPELRDDTPIAPAEWDSVVVLDLIAAIDESYGVTIPIDDLNACRTVGDLRGRITEAAQTK